MGRLISLLLVLLGIIVTVLALLPSAPWSGSVLGTDPGVFLYIGRKILSGSVPYRDIWDHKPPLIYYVNALGLLISGQSRWGVWIIEGFSLFAAVVLSFVSMSKTLGRIPAFFGTGMWLISLPIILREGNYTEEFALPFQFAAIHLFQRAALAKDSSHYRWHWIGIGATTAIAFLYRPNLIGIGLAIALSILCIGLFQRTFRVTVRKLTLITLGFVLVVLPVGLYFLANNALYDLWDAVFLYNFSYVQEHIVSSELAAVFAGTDYLLNSGIIFLALLGWFCGAAYLLRYGRNAHTLSNPHIPLLLIALIGLPIELILSSISVRPFAHYYIAWIPVLGLLSAFFVYFASNFVVAISKRKSPWLAPLLRFSPFILLFGLLIRVAVQIWPIASLVMTSPPYEHPIVSYMRNTTTADDSVLIWGSAVRYNFVADRDAPGKYIYTWPLYVSSYARASELERFLRDLQTYKPHLIVDTSSTVLTIPPIDPSRRTLWAQNPPAGYAVLPGMNPALDYILSNYTYAGEIPQTQWSAYVYSGP